MRKGTTSAQNDYKDIYMYMDMRFTALQMSIDDLASATARGFQDVHQRIGTIETELKKEIAEFRAEFNERTSLLEETVYIDHRNQLRELKMAK